MSQTSEPRPGGGPGGVQGQHPRSAGVDSSTLPRAGDVVPLSAAIPEAVDAIVRRAEADDKIARWWYRFGVEVGKAAGRAEADEFIARIRLDREDVANLRSTATTCRCGRGEYVRRRSA